MSLTNNEPVPKCKTRESKPSRRNHGSQTENTKLDICHDSKEIDFFRLIHSEFRKATEFFQSTLQEMTLREKRICSGLQLLENGATVHGKDKWSVHATSSLELHRQLLFLESFAIMSFCSFSKILKKHDKVRLQTSTILDSRLKASRFLPPLAHVPRSLATRPELPS